jgi:EAL domain-containing protein (putative c-di-GMP-specific phosphodiesterase class I)
MAKTRPRATAPRNSAVPTVFQGVAVAGIATVFMLFLSASNDLQSTLTIIGMLLCLSLAGFVLRSFSTVQTTEDLIVKTDAADLHLRTLQHRVNDHDLALLELTGKLETLEVDVESLRGQHSSMAAKQQEFTTALKDRMLQLISLLSTRKQAKAKKQAPKSFKMSAGSTANDGASAASAKPVYDEDIYVSPSLIRDAIKMARATERMDIYIQPIATLPHRKVFGYEVYGRLKMQPGVYIPARDFRGIAAHDGALVALDNLVLRELAKTKLPIAPVFINLSRDALSNRATAIQIAQVLRARPELGGQLVIEVTQRDFSRITADDEVIIHELQRLGVSFAMNDVQTTELDLNRMATLSFKYLKLPHYKLITGPTMDHGSALVQRFVTRLQARNITLIAGNVETDKQVRSLLDYPVQLAQGHLFGRPDRPVTYTANRQAA